MYSIYWINFNYYSAETFTDLDRAIEHAKSKGFEFRIDRGNQPVCSWLQFRGLRYF